MRLRHREHHRTITLNLHTGDNRDTADTATRHALSADANKVQGTHARLAHLDVATDQVVCGSRIVSHSSSILHVSKIHTLGLVLLELSISDLHLRRLPRRWTERFHQLLDRAGSSR